MAGPELKEVMEKGGLYGVKRHVKFFSMMVLNRTLHIRVIGDLNLPAGKRFTTTHDAFRFDQLRGSTPLIESGLFGPVRILTVERPAND